MDDKNITRRALGRSAAIGDLYDAITDSFCGKSIFPKSTDAAFETIEQSVTSMNQVYNDNSLFNNLIKFDVEPELALSAMSGLVPLSFLHASVNTRGQAASLLYTVKTKSDRLDIHRSSVKRLINVEDVIGSHATHVVVGIDWGSCSVVSIEESVGDVPNANDSKEYLEYVASRVANNGVKSEKGVDSTSKYDLHFDSDILAGDSAQIPKALDDIVTFIKKVPKIIESEFNGRGKCLIFLLFPLAAFDKDENFDFTACTVQPIELKIIFSLGDLISAICDSKTKIHAIQKLTDRNEFCVPNRIRDIIKMKSAILDQTLKNVTESLVKVRKGVCDAFEFEVIKQAFQDSSSVLDKFFEETRTIVERIDFVNYATEQGALYIGNISTFEEARRKIKPKDEYYVLFYAHKLSDEITSENIGLFNTLMKGNVHCFLADLDMKPDLAEMESVSEGTRICHYIQGGYKDYDVYKTYKADRVFNLVRPLCEMQPIKNKPKERALIQLICPGSLNGGECSSEKQQWVCEKCKCPVEYGFDDMFYCDCGREFMNILEFRCTDVNHGDHFISFDEDVLKTKLNEIKVVPAVNILVLGETGVGKSTWINAIANYLTFPTLQEATEVDDLLCLVPTKFVLLDENCKERTVSIGSSKNEETRAGQACTQNPTSHLVTFGNERIRIIDTPGIGDPRGVEQDKTNVDNILRYVSGLDEIHGICLLLKPNNARLTTFFKFCVKEILTHLHKSSVHNLLFCFTNTRSTFYKPGDTYPPLKELLSEINDNLKKKSRGKADEIVLSGETMFCLDNEAFRFLCARRNNIDFKPEDFQNFSLSWDKSSAETQRMLSFIKSRRPHNVNETMSINEARSTILTLARPMAKITDNIATNIRIAEEQKKFTMSLDDEKLKLEKNRLVQQIQIKTVPIDYPKTVCTDARCVEVRQIPGTGQNMNVYKTVCHDHCYLKGVNVDTVGAPELRGCAAMAKSNNCQRCRCPWQNHMHITYNFEETMVTVPNLSIEKMIRENSEMKHVKEQMILNLEQTIQQYRSEQDEILNISSQFGSLLKRHAIIPYNDAYESHVRQELRLASAEACISTDSAKKEDDLKRLLNEYLEKKRMLDDAMVHNSDYDISVIDVDKLKDSLMNLSLTGESFQNCFQTAANAHSQSFQYVERPVNINKRSKKKFNGAGGGTYHRFTRCVQKIFNYYSSF